MNYVPFHYTTRGKRLGQSYLRHNVLFEDVALLCLAFAWTMEAPIAGGVAVLLLHLSFWVVYEIGYHENDHVATRKEAAPRIPPGSEDYAERMDRTLAGLTALAFALPGVALLVLFDDASLTLSWAFDSRGRLFAATTLVWVLYLGFARATFSLYNRTGTRTRGMLYAALQITRTLGYSVVLEVGLVGALLLTSLVIARWIPYVSYRELGIRWTGTYRVLLLVTFVILCLTGLAADHESMIRWQTIAALAWLVVLARRYLPGTGVILALPGRRGRDTVATSAEGSGDGADDVA